MRIIAWVNKDSGVSYHRLILPLLTMPDVEVFITNSLLEEHFDKGCDVFMYNRVVPDHAIAKLAELKEKHGFKTVVDIDDYWELDPHHILFDAYFEDEFAFRQINHIRNADAVICTHSRLADVIVPYNKHVYICPNAIPKTGQFLVRHMSSDFVRLFWQGSDTHQADVGILAEPIHRLNKIAGKIKMIMAGYVEKSDIWYSMVMDYTANANHQYMLIPYAKPDEYYYAYRNADICLVPLVRSRFNGFKSNLKILEAANLGLPVIASRVDPYLDMPVNYCSKGSDWVSNIKRLVQWQERRKEEGLQLKEFADKNFNFESINTERKQVLEYVASKVSA